MGNWFKSNFYCLLCRDFNIWVKSYLSSSCYFRLTLSLSLSLCLFVHVSLYCKSSTCSKAINSKWIMFKIYHQFSKSVAFKSKWSKFVLFDCTCLNTLVSYFAFLASTLSNSDEPKITINKLLNCANSVLLHDNMKDGWIYAYKWELKVVTFAQNAKLFFWVMLTKKWSFAKKFE